MGQLHSTYLIAPHLGGGPRVLEDRSHVPPFAAAASAYSAAESAVRLSSLPADVLGGGTGRVGVGASDVVLLQRDEVVGAVPRRRRRRFETRRASSSCRAAPPAATAAAAAAPALVSPGDKQRLLGPG